MRSAKCRALSVKCKVDWFLYQVAMLLGNVKACPWPATPKTLDLPHPNPLATPKSSTCHTEFAARGRSHVPCVLDMMCFYFNIGNISISSKFQISMSYGFLWNQVVFLFLEIVFCKISCKTLIFLERCESKCQKKCVFKQKDSIFLKNGAILF